MPEGENGYGALAAALAKAQAAFPAIERNKEVTVQTKTGGSYKFKYAPLDSILAAVRVPLSDNGLSIVQLLDDDTLVTSLLHTSGAMLSGRTPLPPTEGIQAFGSAITYLRRYSIQALLGIAAEEDDDGNHAAGNRATFGKERNLRVGAADHEPVDAPNVNGGLIGVATRGQKMTDDFHVRQTTEGPFLGFRLKDGGKTGFLMEVLGPMAEDLYLMENVVVDARVQVWGHWVNHPLQKGGSYDAYRIERISGPGFTLPEPTAVDGGASGPSQTEAARAEDEPPPSAASDAELDAEIDALPMFQDNAA